MATVGSAKSTLVDKINSLTAAATPKDTIFLAKALGEATSLTNFVWKGTWSTGTEYAIDDVVNEGVSSYVCIQAHTAGATFAGDSAKWDAIAVGANIPSQTGNSGKVLKTDGSSLSWGDGLPTGGTSGQFITTDGTTASWGDVTPSGVLYTHHFEDATRNIALSDGSTGAPITFTFNKQYADSYIVVKGRTPNSGQNSYHAGCYIEIDGTRKYEAAHFMAPPGGATDDQQHGVIFWDGIWTNMTTTGNKTVTLGWASRDGSTQRPSNYWNPDARSARMRARTTVIDIFEVPASAVTSFT